jgi:hypothetical protein
MLTRFRHRTSLNLDRWKRQPKYLFLVGDDCSSLVWVAPIGLAF